MEVTMGPFCQSRLQLEQAAKGTCWQCYTCGLLVSKSYNVHLRVNIQWDPSILATDLDKVDNIKYIFIMIKKQSPIHACVG